MVPATPGREICRSHAGPASGIEFLHADYLYKRALENSGFVELASDEFPVAVEEDLKAVYEFVECVVGSLEGSFEERVRMRLKGVELRVLGKEIGGELFETGLELLVVCAAGYETGFLQVLHEEHGPEFGNEAVEDGQRTVIGIDLGLP